MKMLILALVSAILLAGSPILASGDETVASKTVPAPMLCNDRGSCTPYTGVEPCHYLGKKDWLYWFWYYLGGLDCV